MKFRRAGLPQEFAIEMIAVEDGAARVRVGDTEVSARIETTHNGALVIRIGNCAFRLFSARVGNSILVAAGPVQFEFVPVETAGRRHTHGLATPEVVAPMPGKVLRVLVAEGEQVEAGSALIVLEAMKMETVLAAEGTAIVTKIHVSAGTMVEHGAVLLELGPPAATSASESAAQAD